MNVLISLITNVDVNPNYYPFLIEVISKEVEFYEYSQDILTEVRELRIIY